MPDVITTTRSMNLTPKHLLTRFLVERYSSRKQLVDLLERVPHPGDREEPDHWLPSQSEGSAWSEYVKDCVEVMNRRGYLRLPLFQRLLSDHPPFGNEIRQIARKTGYPLEGKLSELRPQWLTDHPSEDMLYPHWVERRTGGAPTLQRIYELMNRDDAVGRRSVVHLAGSLGSGRTRTALQFADRFARAYDVILHVELPQIGLLPPSARSQETITQVRKAVADIAARWGLRSPTAPGVGQAEAVSELDEISANFEAFFEFIRDLSYRCLMIIDEVQDMRMAGECLPRDCWIDAIVIGSTGSSRNESVTLDPLTLSESREMVLGSCGADKEWSRREIRAASALAERLGNLPLTLALVSRLIGTYRPSELLEEITRAHAERVRNPPGAKSYGTDVLFPHTLFETLGVSEQTPGAELVAKQLDGLVAVLQARIQREGIGSNPLEDELAELVLRVCAWIAPDQPLDRLPGLPHMVEELILPDRSRGGAPASSTSPVKFAHIRNVLELLLSSGILVMRRDLTLRVHALTQIALRRLFRKSTVDLDRLVTACAREATAKGSRPTHYDDLDDVDFTHRHALLWNYILLKNKETGPRSRGAIDLKVLPLLEATAWRLLRAGQLSSAVSILESSLPSSLAASGRGEANLVKLARLEDIAAQAMLAGARSPSKVTAATRYQRARDLLEAIPESRRGPAWEKDWSNLTYSALVERLARIQGREQILAATSELEAAVGRLRSLGDLKPRGAALAEARLACGQGSAAYFAEDAETCVLELRAAERRLQDAIEKLGGLGDSPHALLHLQARRTPMLLTLRSLSAASDVELRDLELTLTQLSGHYPKGLNGAHINVALILRRLAQIKTILGDLPEAAGSLERSLAIERAHDEASSRVAECLQLIAAVETERALLLGLPFADTARPSLERARTALDAAQRIARELTQSGGEPDQALRMDLLVASTRAVLDVVMGEAKPSGDCITSAQKNAVDHLGRYEPTILHVQRLIDLFPAPTQGAVRST